MTALLIPLSHLKTYTRLIKKQNPSANLKHTNVLNVLCWLLGWTDYSNYERHINKSHNPTATDSGTPIVPVNRLPLHELENLATTLAASLPHELATDHDSVVELPPSLTVGDRHLPSTPLDTAIRYQVAHLDQMPALRMSGALYLVAFLSGVPVFDTEQWQVDWPKLVDYLKADDLPEALRGRLAHHALLNARHGHAYHEGILEAARGSLLAGSLDATGFIQRIQDTLIQEQAYLANARLGPPVQGQPDFSFPVAQDASDYTQTLAVVADTRRLTNPSQPLLLGTPRPVERTMTSGGVIRAKRVSRWSDRRQPLTISTHTLRKNLLLLGSPGVGRSMATHFLFHQALMNNAGVVIVDTKGNPQDYWATQSIAKVHGKESNLSLFTIHHQRQLGCLNLTDCIRQSHSRYLMLPPMEKAPGDLKAHVWSILDRLGRTVPGTGEPLNGRGFPYLVILNDVLPAITTENDLSAFQQFINRMNRNQVAVILSSKDLYSPLGIPAPMLAGLFGGYLLMRQEGSGGMPLSVDTVTATDIRYQSEGEFRYATRDGIDPVPYRFPYAVPELTHHLYLVMG